MGRMGMLATAAAMMGLMDTGDHRSIGTRIERDPLKPGQRRRAKKLRKAQAAARRMTRIRQRRWRGGN